MGVRVAGRRVGWLPDRTAGCAAGWDGRRLPRDAIAVTGVYLGCTFAVTHIGTMRIDWAWIAVERYLDNVGHAGAGSASCPTAAFPPMKRLPVRGPAPLRSVQQSPGTT